MNNLILRDYQISALAKVKADLLKSPEPVLLSAIMGSGKTVISCCLIADFFREYSGMRFLILAHKQELVQQFQNTFAEKSSVPDYEIGIACDGLNQKIITAKITIATVQTFIALVDKYAGCDLLIIDECHRAFIGNDTQYKKVLDTLKSKVPNMRILGITATPFRTGHGFIFGNTSRGQNLFPKCNYKVRYETLKNQGFLMPLHGEVAVANSMQHDMATVSKQGGDYVINQISAVMQKSVHLQTAVDAINSKCSDYKYICIFCCDIDHAETLKNRIGNECTTVHSKLSDFDRLQNMADWKSGRKRIITSVNILVEGFDFPPLDCLVFARPTLSPVLFLQAVGRVLRIHPGKEKCFLLDLTENTARFGTDLDKIKVEISGNGNGEKQKPNEKVCPDCYTFVHPARMICPECGFVFPMKEYEESLPPQLEKVTFQKEPPVKHHVEYVTFNRHQKEGKPDSVRVEYHNTNPFRSRIASEWICFEHGGYAATKAQQWWKKMTRADYTPETTDEALAVIQEVFIEPAVIFIEKDGKFDRIVDYGFENHYPDEDSETADMKSESMATEIPDEDIPF